MANPAQAQAAVVDLRDQDLLDIVHWTWPKSERVQQNKGRCLVVRNAFYHCPHGYVHACVGAGGHQKIEGKLGINAQKKSDEELIGTNHIIVGRGPLHIRHGVGDKCPKCRQLAIALVRDKMSQLVSGSRSDEGTQNCQLRMSSCKECGAKSISLVLCGIHVGLKSFVSAGVAAEHIVVRVESTDGCTQCSEPARA